MSGEGVKVFIVRGADEGEFAEAVLKTEYDKLRQVLNDIKTLHTNWIQGARADIIYEEMGKVLEGLY